MFEDNRIETEYPKQCNILRIHLLHLSDPHVPGTAAVKGERGTTNDSEFGIRRPQTPVHQMIQFGNFYFIDAVIPEVPDVVDDFLQAIG